MWHASISVQDASGRVPWQRCGLKARALVREAVLGLLSGVGTGDTRRDRSELVLHARRRLSAREIEQLAPAWCAIPATGMAGDGIPW